MAGQRGRSGDRALPAEDWKHLLLVGGLVGAVLFLLILGATLQTNEAPAFSESVAGVAEFDELQADESVPATEPGVQSAGVDLAQRAGLDERRIQSGTGQWTLQFMLACDPANVQPIVSALLEDPDLLVLAKSHEGRPCFRLCWGRYSTRADALAARRYPEVLDQITDKPQALLLQDALE